MERRRPGGKRRPSRPVALSGFKTPPRRRRSTRPRITDAARGLRLLSFVVQPDDVIVVITGVTGAGKTTVGKALAQRLGWSFYDADDFHPPPNIAKMASGSPLTDADREPWLKSLHELLLRVDGQQQSAVLACSALKSKYRASLSGGIRDLRWVYLRADAGLIRQRLAQRPDHFMSATLIESQFAVLEEPSEATVIDANQSVDDALVRILEVLVLRR